MTLMILGILYYIVSVGWMGYHLISDSYESDELTVASLLGYIFAVPLIAPVFFPIFAGDKLSEIKIRKKKKDNKPYFLKKNDIINEELNNW
jgi:hypothetical protein